MKPVVAFIAAFVVATGASTGASVAMHKGKVKPADSLATASDSTKSDSALKAGADSGAKSDSAKAPAKPGSDSVAPGVLPAGASHAAQPAPVTPPKPGVAVAAPDTGGPERRLAKLFSAMEPAEAAKTLEKMTDADVQVILGYVGTRQAAAILAAMPADRVATLSKLALHGRGK